MSKTKDNDKIEVVLINPIPIEVDGKVVIEEEEVFLQRKDPYLNEVRRAPVGTYKLGAFTENTIAKKEELEKK